MPRYPSPTRVRTKGYRRTILARSFVASCLNRYVLLTAAVVGGPCLSACGEDDKDASSNATEGTSDADPSSSTSTDGSASPVGSNGTLGSNTSEGSGEATTAPSEIETDEAGGSSGGELGPPVAIPVSEYCPPDLGGQVQNPDLTRTLPGTTWDAMTACIYDGYYYDWSNVQRNGVTGEVVVRLAFDDATPTLDMLVELSYTEEIEIDRDSFYYMPEDCDETLRRLLGTSLDYTTWPLHQGYVSDESSCTPTRGTWCACDLVTHFVDERVNTGFLYIGGNGGVELDDEKLLLFAFEDDSFSFDVRDNGAQGQLEATQATVVMQRVSSR